MGFSSSVTPIHNSPHPSPDASINAIYAGSPGINSLHLVSSADASFSSCRIPSTNCLTAVYFVMFTHYGSIPSTVFTGTNIPFAVGIPIVVWRNFPMTERNILKYNRPLWITSFRACNIFRVYMVLLRQKSNLEFPLLFPAVTCPFPIFSF